MQGNLQGGLKSRTPTPALGSIGAPQLRNRFATPPSAPGPAVPTPQGNAFGLAGRINNMRHYGQGEGPPSIPPGFGGGIDINRFKTFAPPPMEVDPAPGMMGSIAPPLGPDGMDFMRPARIRWGF